MRCSKARILPQLLVGCFVAFLSRPYSCNAAAAALTPSRRHRSHRRRAPHRGGSSSLFTQEVLLPPLEPLDGNNKQPPAFVQNELPAIYTNDPHCIAQWLADHVPSQGCTLGLDVESVPVAPWIMKRASFRGPATVQLATLDSSLVVHLTTPIAATSSSFISNSRRRRSSSRDGAAVARLLQAVFRDASIIKAGCNIDQDLLDLKQRQSTEASQVSFRRMQADSRLELGHLRFVDKNDAPGLKTLSHRVLGVHLPKSRKLAVSDWSRVPLTDAQVAYGARDAWVGAAVAATLQADHPAAYDEFWNQLQRHERSLTDLHQRYKRRKRAQYQLQSILAPYRLLQQQSNASGQQQRKNNGASSSSFLQLPPLQAQRVEQLQAVIRENRLERGPALLQVDESLLFPPPENIEHKKKKNKRKQDVLLEPSSKYSLLSLPLHNRTGQAL